MITITLLLAILFLVCTAWLVVQRGSDLRAIFWLLWGYWVVQIVGALIGRVIVP